MIRINLLPQSKRQVRTAAAAPKPGNQQVWVVVYAIALIAWCAVLATTYFLTNKKLEEQQLKNTTLAQRIEELKQKAGNLEELKAKLERSMQLEAVVQKLQAARLGPARVLVELIKILSVSGGPSIDPQKLEQMRRDNPLAGYNPSWDVRRLWLTSFQEENRECRMQGFGKTNEDVAEFLRRLALSDWFQEVTLQKTEATTDPDSKLAMIGFELTCKVKY